MMSSLSDSSDDNIIVATSSPQATGAMLQNSLPTPLQEIDTNIQPAAAASASAAASALASSAPDKERRGRGRPPKLLNKNDFRTPASLENAKDLKVDLADFGLSKKQITNIVATREYAVDGTAQHPHGQTREQRETERKNLTAKNGARVQRAQKEKYEPLRLDRDGGDWVLFDPEQGFPRGLGEPPAFFHKFMTYVPGNKRILESSMTNASVRIKWTPAVLEGKQVEYTRAGPKLVELNAGKRKTCKVLQPERSSEIDGTESELNEPDAMAVTEEEESVLEIGDSQEQNA